MDELATGKQGVVHNIESLLLAQLKALCRKRGLAMSGTKAALAARLLKRQARSAPDRHRWA